MSAARVLGAGSILVSGLLQFAAISPIWLDYYTVIYVRFIAIVLFGAILLALRFIKLDAYKGNKRSIRNLDGFALLFFLAAIGLFLLGKSRAHAEPGSLGAFLGLTALALMTYFIGRGMYRLSPSGKSGKAG